MQLFKNSRFFSLFLVVLLVLTPIQQATFAETIDPELEEQGPNDEANNEEANETTDSEEEENEQTKAATEPTVQETKEGNKSTSEDTKIEVPSKTSEKQQVADDQAAEENSGASSTSIKQQSSDDFNEDEFVIEMDGEISTTSSTATVHWTVNQDIIENFDVFLNGDLIDKIPGTERSYTFTGLTPNETYYFDIEATIDNKFIDSIYSSFTTYWTEDELYPVNIITAINDYPYYNDFIRIRGLDDNNKMFNVIEQSLDYGINDLYLPLGKYEVLIYNNAEPSISAAKTIEIKAGVDYLNNPIQLQFKLKEMRDAAQPFEYEITDVQENSFTISWNDVSKINGFSLVAEYWGTNYDDYYYLEYFFDNDRNKYTVDGLTENTTYYIIFGADYEYNLEDTKYFFLKTLGLDANAPDAHFENEKLKRMVTEKLGVHLRNVTEADLKELTSLELEYEGINSLKGLEAAENLIILYAYRNEISDISSLKNLTNLVTLDLGDNRLSNIDALANLTNLQLLDINRNNVEDISIVGDLTNIEKLNASSNKISNIEVLKNLANLERLELSENNIVTIDAITNLTNLDYLGLSYNKLTEIPDLSNLYNLTELRLINNEIKDISGLTGLKNLKFLDAGENKISELPDLSSLTNLQQLYLYQNQISDISGLVNLKNLEYLDLSQNNISQLPELSKLTSLEELILEENNITDIEGLKGLTNLTYVDLSENNISKLPDLSSLENLTDLHLFENELTDIEGLKGLTSLEYLDLANNKISNLPDLSSLKNLTYLYLDNNELTDISGLKGLDNLEVLDLSGNHITDITVLKELPRLHTLYLYGNDITDTETIWELRNDGVEVYYDGEDDWNEWEDEEDPWVDEEIDAEAVKEAFPEDLGFDVSDDGTEIKIDLSEQSTEEPFTLTTEQLQVLTNSAQKVKISRGEVTTAIPASAFGNSPEPVEIFVEKVENNPSIFSETYDFTIKQGTRNISTFNDGVTLTFNVNADRAKNPNNLKVHYYNEETNEWENIGGTYSNGAVTVVTYHFSTFTVFEVEEIDHETPGEGEGGAGSDEETNGDDGGKSGSGEDSKDDKTEAMKELRKIFPRDKNFVVGKKSVTASLGNNEKIELSAEQIKTLKENKLPIVVSRNGVELNIPTTIFNGNENVEISVQKLPDVEGSLSSTFKFTIKQGGKIISQFNDDITLAFEVDEKRAKNTDNLQVFYLNEKTGKWEKVGGTYNNGVVSAKTDHFSTFTVFEYEDGKIVGSSTTVTDEQMSDGKDSTVKVAGSDDASDGEKLPKTATNSYNLLIIGAIVIAAGILVFFLRPKKIRVK